MLNTPLTLGAERVGSDNAIAVARNDANHVVVAYVDSPALGQMQVVVSESTDGGANWTEKFRTPLATRSAEPALTILDDGQIVLLYNNYNPQTDELSQHLVATSDDFATTTDTILATENNSTNNGPADQYSPYLGDFFDLTSLGNDFYGIFSASNADDGTLASYLFNCRHCFSAVSRERRVLGPLHSATMREVRFHSPSIRSSSAGLRSYPSRVLLSCSARR